MLKSHVLGEGRVDGGRRGPIVAYLLLQTGPVGDVTISNACRGEEPSKPGMQRGGAKQICHAGGRR